MGSALKVAAYLCSLACLVSAASFVLLARDLYIVLGSLLAITGLAKDLTLAAFFFVFARRL